MNWRSKGGDETIILENVRHVGPSTPKAVLIEYGLKELWLPRSQIVNFFGPFGDDLDMYEYHVTEWWAGKNGLG